MLSNIQLHDILFLDIETVPVYPDYHELPEQLRELWDHKAGFIAREPQAPYEVYERAGIYAEFGKIICISVGVIDKTPSGTNFRLKSFYGENEKALLEKFVKFLQEHYSRPRQLLCAHNGKEFDFPFLSRRILVNGLALPKILNIAGRKPWEVPHLDTMELWKFGDYKHYSSLQLLAAIFNIPTPKNDISGKDVAKVFYKEKNLPRIVEYCQKDVLTVAQIFLKYRGEELIEQDNVVVVD